MKDSLDSLYEAYFRDIYRFLYSLSHDHHTAEDLIQETFFRAHLYIENYNGEKAKTWLFTVAYHAFIDYRRKHKRTVITEQGFFHELSDKKKGPADTIIVREEVDEVIRLLDNPGFEQSRRTRNGQGRRADGELPIFFHVLSETERVESIAK